MVKVSWSVVRHEATGQAAKEASDSSHRRAQTTGPDDFTGHGTEHAAGETTDDSATEFAAQPPLLGSRNPAMVAPAMTPGKTPPAADLIVGGQSGTAQSPWFDGEVQPGDGTLECPVTWRAVGE